MSHTHTVTPVRCWFDTRPVANRMYTTYDGHRYAYTTRLWLMAEGIHPPRASDTHYSIKSPEDHTMITHITHHYSKSSHSTRFKSSNNWNLQCLFKVVSTQLPAFHTATASSAVPPLRLLIWLLNSSSSCTREPPHRRLAPLLGLIPKILSHADWLEDGHRKEWKWVQDQGLPLSYWRLQRQCLRSPHRRVRDCWGMGDHRPSSTRQWYLYVSRNICRFDFFDFNWS